MTFRSRKFSLLNYYSIDRNSRAAAVRVMIFLLIYSRMGKSSSKQNQFDLKVDDFSRFDRAHVTTINHAPGVRGCLYQIKSKNRTSKNNFLRQNYTIVSRDRRHPTFETSSRSLLRFIIRSAMETNIRRTSNLVTIVHGLKQSNRFLTTPKNERSASSTRTNLKFSSRLSRGLVTFSTNYTVINAE